MILGELVKRKDTSISQQKEPIIVEPTESDKGKMEYYKTELDKMKGIEDTIKSMNDKYIKAINDKSIIKSKYEQEIELNRQLINELTILKSYKMLIEITCLCPHLKKKINIFDCNRGYNNYCKRGEECSNRRIILEDIKNKYID